MFCVSPLVKRLTPGWVGPGVWGIAAAIALASSPHALAQAEAPAGPDASPTVSGGRIVRPTLQLGSQGESVRELQSMLMLLGYYPGPVTGVYSEDTAAAARRFQGAAGITADGIVGPATWSRLFPTPPGEANPPTATTPAAGGTPPSTGTPSTGTPSTGTPSTGTTPPATTPLATSTSATTALPILRPGMEGDAVRQLQQRLRTKGFYSGAIDGIFGSQTEAAVRQAQTASDLTIDGIVGPATWRALN
ncbi:MAG: peptidoglycan-binding protein [Shackletoniella antarctica]|uniref:Peptidoglycan-binding protein n=1 Tax=Shackletoniella antarctica TaxID=268115 RepID=A0A2W4YRY5_9CYAN|nr:MAG: peptidoglycan-binding protein [Shackletoniella antarctica]